jgi:hypothetical protein
VNVGISSCAEHATASSAQTYRIAPHHGEKLDGQKDHDSTGNSYDHHWRAARTSSWFAHTSHG